MGPIRPRGYTPALLAIDPVHAPSSNQRVIASQIHCKIHFLFRIEFQVERVFWLFREWDWSNPTSDKHHSRLWCMNEYRRRGNTSNRVFCEINHCLKKYLRGLGEKVSGNYIFQYRANEQTNNHQNQNFKRNWIFSFSICWLFILKLKHFFLKLLRNKKDPNFKLHIAGRFSQSPVSKLIGLFQGQFSLTFGGGWHGVPPCG